MLAQRADLGGGFTERGVVRLGDRTPMVLVREAEEVREAELDGLEPGGGDGGELFFERGRRCADGDGGEGGGDRVERGARDFRGHGGGGEDINSCVVVRGTWGRFPRQVVFFETVNVNNDAGDVYGLGRLVVPCTRYVPLSSRVQSVIAWQYY